MMTNFHLNTTVVAIFPNVCLWRRSLCSDLVLTLKNCIEPPSYARTAYVVAIWPSFLFHSFVKIWATWRCFWANGLRPPLAKNFPLRLCLPRLRTWIFPSLPKQVLIHSFHSEVIKLLRQNSEVLRILINIRLKINKK